MAATCSICGSDVTTCICNVNIRESRPKDTGGMEAVLRLYWPVPEGTRVSQIFGVNPSWYPTSRGHNGVDFAIVVGTPIKAMANGTVIRADANDGKTGYGRHVRIQHTTGISIYGHLSVLMCAVGDTIVAGQTIGLSGGAVSDPGSGWSTGPHLHAEFRVTDTPNPVPGGWVYNAVDILPLLTNTQVRIVDLSSWDEPIAYGDYDGVIPRVYNGTAPDSKFTMHRDGAKAAGKPWWPYSFYNFLHPAEPQAHAVASILTSDKGNLPVYWDVEEWKYWDAATQTWIWVRYPPRTQLLAGLFGLYDTYKTLTEQTSGFYLNSATIHYLKPVPSWLLACPEWVAHWGTTNPDYEPWVKPTFHQYQGEPDHSRYWGPDAEYWALVNPSVPPPPPGLPDIVRTTAGTLYVHQTPDGVANGDVQRGTLFGVEGKEIDHAGRGWLQVGVQSWVLEMHCEEEKGG